MASKYNNSRNLQMIACGYGVHSNLFDFLKPIEILKLKKSLCDEGKTSSLRVSYIKRYIDEALRSKLLDFLEITDKKTFNELFDNGVMYFDTKFRYHTEHYIRGIIDYNDWIRHVKDFNIINFLFDNGITYDVDIRHIYFNTTKDKIANIAKILDDVGYVVRTDGGEGIRNYESLCKYDILYFKYNNIRVFLRIKRKGTYFPPSKGICFPPSNSIGDFNGVCITKNELNIIENLYAHRPQFQDADLKYPIENMCCCS